MRFYGNVEDRLAASHRRPSRAVHVGNAHGLIALWLDETEAIDLVHYYGLHDLGAQELLAAVEQAYPSEDSNQDRDPASEPEPS